jgi:hypothetical protein
LQFILPLTRWDELIGSCQIFCAKGYLGHSPDYFYFTPVVGIIIIQNLHSY